jgi:hypothetical protein
MRAGGYGSRRLGFAMNTNKWPSPFTFDFLLINVKNVHQPSASYNFIAFINSSAIIDQTSLDTEESRGWNPL